MEKNIKKNICILSYIAEINNVNQLYFNKQKETDFNDKRDLRSEGLLFPKNKRDPSLISLTTPVPPKDVVLACWAHSDKDSQEETPHLWAWARADPASSGTGEARWPGSPSGALSPAAACLHHLGGDTLINNENRTDTEITRTEGGDGTGAESAWRLIFLEETLALSDRGSCNPGSFC